MIRKLLILLLTQWLIVLFSVSAFAYTGESDLSDTIRVLNIMTGQTSSDEIPASDHVDGDRKIGLGEAIYWMQDAAGIPYVDLQAQDYDEDFLLSTLALDVTVGQCREVVIFDTPRVGIDNQAYNREDLVITTIQGLGVARVERDDPTDSVEDSLYYVRGLSPGVAVFQISYDGYTGQKPLLAVNVMAADAAGPALETDITLTKYDTVYFTGNSVDFTFSVTTGEAAAVSAQLNGTVYTPADGSFTLPLTNGYNPIVITATGDSGTTTQVVNLRAKKCAVTMVNNTRPGSDLLYEGDAISLNFTGLMTPVPKVSRIYNPSANRITYDTTMSRYSVITGGTAQYNIKNVEMELTAAGTHTLTGGHIDTNWFGDPLYSERSVGTAPPNTAASQTDKSFSLLPDIEISVLENPAYDPDLFTISVANTEDIWPGDQVVLSIPDLDIATIDENHPQDSDKWNPPSLLDSHTIFATDIPGLKTVTSTSAVVNYELENLKTIKFMVPDDTAPGTYHVRGGYVWVMYGPSWWKKVTYYHKAKIPDVTIEVVEAVPGQIHGVVEIESSTLKSRLAQALGLGADYSDVLTSSQLKTLTGTLDLSDCGITDADMDLMQYLIGVTAIDLSGNPGITPESVRKSTFDWTLEKYLDFSGCTGLTQLGNRAFYECTNLKGFVFPDTLTHIGESCFSGCTGLAGVTLPAHLTTMGDDAFALCTALIQITIPDGVTVLGESVFRYCTNLQNVQLPVNLETIGAYCFSWCRNLTEIILPVSLTSIGDYCFHRCGSLTKLILPEALATIGNHAFYHCDALAFINIPAALTTIGSGGTFGDEFNVVDGRQSQMTRDELGLSDDTVFLIGDDAGVEPQSAEIEAGRGTLTLTHRIPDSETVVWGSSDTHIAVVADGVVIGVSSGIAYIYAKSASDSHSGYCRVTVTDSGRATLSSLSLSGIALNETFDPLRYFYTADIAGDVRSTVATLQAGEDGSTLTVNGEAATSGSPTADITLAYPETVITITVTSADDAVAKTYAITITMAPVTEKDDGQVAIGNPVLKDRLAAAAGKETGIYTENLTVTELAGITGAMDLSGADLLDVDLAVMHYLSGVEAIDLSDNTAFTRTPLADNFDWRTEKRLDFSGCTGMDEWHGFFEEIENLIEIILPETVTKIYSAAFRDCTRLSHVVLPAALTTLNSSTFSGCTSLTRIDLPEGLEALPENSFTGSGLKTIDLPSSLNTLGSYCFSECERLTHLIIPAGVTEIGASCFKDSALALLDLRQTAFTAADTAGWEIPDTTLVVYPDSASAGLNTTSAELVVGEEGITLSHGIPDGLTVIWTSTNPDVALVSAHGVVTGVSAGTTLIMVFSKDGTYFDYCEVIFTETQTPGLAGLTLTGATPHQAFDPARHYYTAQGGYFTPLQITAVPADPSSTLTVNGSVVSAGVPSDPVDLPAGDTVFTVAVATGSAVRTYTIVVTLDAIYEGDTGVSIANTAFLRALAVAAGKGEGYAGVLTYEELASIMFDLDLSGLNLTDADMAVMKYLRGVSAMDLSGNTALTAASVKGDIFNWTMLSTIDFSGCTGITEILDSAFEGYEYLSGITLPATVTRMGREVFRNCSALQGIDLSGIPASALADARYLFQGCTAITGMANIVLPEGLTALPQGFFGYCTGITAIDLPAGVTALGNHVFSHCTGITEADLSGMTQLGQGVLLDCNNLTHVVLPDGITSLLGMFNGCSALTTVDLPDSLTSIGPLCFSESGITHLVVPAGVTSIGFNCFYKSNDLGILDLSATSLTSKSLQVAVVPSTTTVLYAATDAGLSATELTLVVGETATLTHAIPAGTAVSWISSNRIAATVTDEGVVTGTYAGTAMIAVKADDGSYNGTCEVTVTAAP